MARDIISDVDQSYSEILHSQDFCFGVAFRENHSMDFHGRGPKLLEIHSAMDVRVRNMKNISLNNLKMVKITFNCLILRIFVIFCGFNSYIHN